ncbi:hypothetical protein FB567DRAFT_598793 [Paraphoma chrysanthemicola]|uniref:Uncharacterized protein n=1 Tax=Paraphoma chrysanthemicola TaxID=798071 RepID=A0A8K0VSQ7_9PLEO|nr:hypothetical protein FB567DRAFT_598793 [Paraphoma chrysanthemicola]
MTAMQKPTETSLAVAAFRIADEPSDASGSDSDQSAQSERDLSPSKKEQKVSKSKKRRTLKQERRQVGALTDELGTLLGAAFQEPVETPVNVTTPFGVAHTADHDQAMDLETTSTNIEKTMSKRTRQNMMKMEQRRLAREMQKQDHSRQQTAVLVQAKPSSGSLQNQRKQNAKEKTQARRLRKEKARARKAGTEAMDIG